MGLGALGLWPRVESDPVRALAAPAEQLDAAVASRLAERLSLPVAMLDPLGADGWEAMMTRNLDALTAALAASGGGGP